MVINIRLLHGKIIELSGDKTVDIRTDSLLRQMRSRLIFTSKAEDMEGDGKTTSI